jgi:hypothetical protein
MKNKTFDLGIPKSNLDSVEMDKTDIILIGIKVDKFYLPDTMDCDDVAEILAKEDTSDLQDILECLKKKLEKQNIKFTFTIK